MNKNVFIKLIDRLNELLKSESIDEQEKTQLSNLKTQVERSLETFELLEEAKKALFFWEVIELIVRFFGS